MEFQAKAIDIVAQRTDCAVIAVYKGGKLSPSAQALNKACNGIVQQLIKKENLTGKPGQAAWLQQPAGSKAERVLLLGCGAGKDGKEGDFRKVLQKMANAVKTLNIKDVMLCLDDFDVKSRDDVWKAQHLATIVHSAHYEFKQHKTTKDDDDSAKLRKVTVTTHDAKRRKQLQMGLKVGDAIAQGMALARDLGNQPGNICTPTYLGKEAKRLARNQSTFTSKILQEKDMKELGMGALLSVAAGSEQPAQLIVMEYKGGKKNQAPHVLVGKGITFDSGGISLKPGAGMDEMKFDMCGAASVFGAMQSLLLLQPSINVVAIVAASENMPNGRATKPGDIVTSMSGQTIEVLNTDAEGRLVLCDALTYAERFKPSAVVDVATLTGACVIALGKHATALYSNQDTLAEALLQAGKQTGDRAWPMPLWDEYQKQLDSNFADIANIGGREAGSVTAACFLARFAKKYAWAHLDIAGTAWLSGAKKGATGRPVPLLVQYLLNQC